MSDLKHFRELLAFALTVAETEGVPIYGITCTGGETVVVHLDVTDKAAVRRLAAALGATDLIENTTDTTYSVHSRGIPPFYWKGEGPYPHHGESVPFGDRLVGVGVFCGLPDDERGDR